MSLVFIVIETHQSSNWRISPPESERLLSLSSCYLQAKAASDCHFFRNLVKALQRMNGEKNPCNSDRKRATDSFVLVSITWTMRNRVSGGFCLIPGVLAAAGLMCIAGNKEVIYSVVKSEFQCSGGDITFGASLILVLCSIACLSAIAALLIAFGCILHSSKKRNAQVWRRGGLNQNTATEIQSKTLKDCPSRRTNTRLKATCSYKPNIHLITSDKQLSFSPLTGELNWSMIHNPASANSQSNENGTKNNYRSTIEDISHSKHLDGRVSTTRL